MRNSIPVRLRARPDTAKPPATEVVELLRQRGATLATAESLTGGRLAALLTEIPGSSEAYRGGVVAYATQMKIQVLGVSETVVERHGVVSAECAGAMARGVRRLTGATYGVSTTGVAGPEEQEGKPVGTVYLGVSGPDGDNAIALELVGDRGTIQGRTCREALEAFAARLREAGSQPATGRGP
jgi:PncC family amidohydrolase